MPNRAIAITLIFIGFLAASAHAQTFGPAWESDITLTQEDLDLIHRTVDTQVHARPVGTTVAWSNPNTGNAGTIKLLKRFNLGSLRCEQIAYTLTTTKRSTSSYSESGETFLRRFVEVLPRFADKREAVELTLREE
jgi:hypothetical protein